MRNVPGALPFLLTCVCALCVAQPIHAQVNLRMLRAQAPGASLQPFRHLGQNYVSTMVRIPSSDVPLAEKEGLVRLGPELFATRRTPEALSRLLDAHQGWQWIWSPPKRPLLDRATTNVRADQGRRDFGYTGSNVIVGVVDSGLDLTHPDLRLPNGNTRVLYYLDLTQSSPYGTQPALEQKYGCNSTDQKCAVYTAEDINALLKTPSSSKLPIDAIGHGTHVASLAAGNGLATSPAKYVGIAPEADLVIVNGSRANMGDFQDTDIVLGTQFVFDVAASLGKPAVVNLSLGGDAGAHDGTSDLEVELSKLVGPQYPGRAIVVAAGNSADLDSNSNGYPAPLGIHTSVQVLPDGNKTRVPLLIDTSANTRSESQVLIWVQSRVGDDLSMGVDLGSDECIAPIGLNRYVESRRCGGATISMLNGMVDESVTSIGGGSRERPPIVLLATGVFDEAQVLNLTFEGSGTAFLWVQTSGGLQADQCEHGACVPAATRERTVAIPAADPDLIAVGATYNRTDWTDIGGSAITLDELAGRRTSINVGDVCGFSGGGPNQLDNAKPDIVAPGGLVAAALSHYVDPRIGSNATSSMFSGANLCPRNDQNCLLVDDYHALALGTSMAAPLVTGAAALLFQANPQLTQADIRNYLTSGAQAVPGAAKSSPAQQGAGLLDVQGALRAQAQQGLTNGQISRTMSWVSVATALVHPDQAWPVHGGLHLRDAQGQAVTIDASRVTVRVTPGHLVTPVTLVGYGYYTFDFVADAGSGRQMLELDVQVDTQPALISEQVYIGVDVGSTRDEVVAGHGCNVAVPGQSPRSTFFGLCFTLGALCVARRRSRRQA